MTFSLSARSCTTVRCCFFCLCGLLGNLFPAMATPINYGDFLGTNVDYIQVVENTQTAGDPDSLLAAPVLNGAGDGLSFSPTVLTSTVGSGASDMTESLLTTTIMAQAGSILDGINFNASGDTMLTSFPPFGTPTTNTSVALSGTVTLLETLSGPIVPVVIPFSAMISPTGSFSLPGDFGVTNWSTMGSLDIAAVVPDATKANLALSLQLDSNTAPGATTADIALNTLNLATVLTPTSPSVIPVPGVGSLLLLGLFLLRRRLLLFTG